MAVIPGVVTDDGRQFFAKFLGAQTGFTPATSTIVGTQWDPRIKFFKMGEGGWIDPGTGRVPRTADPALRRLSSPLIQDLDAAVDTTRAAIDQRYPADSRFTFEKALTVADLTFESPSTLRVRCLLDFAEANVDSFLTEPRFFEIGIFTDHPTISGLASDQGLMLAYATFPEEAKNSGKQLENIVRITF